MLEGECECEIYISQSYKVVERRYDRLCPSTFEEIDDDDDENA